MTSENQLKELYREIVQQLENKPTSKSKLTWFHQQHKNPDITAYGITTPVVRKLIKQNLTRFRELSLKDRNDIAKMFYKSKNFEQSTFGDTLVELNLLILTPADFPEFDKVVRYINNWASVDWLCLHGLQEILLKYPEETLNLLRSWNRSDSPWKRRASVVVFVRKIGASGRFIESVIEFCENLIWDREEIVQKGVGWALKDNLTGARNTVLNYIKSLRRRGVSSTITLYAIKNLKGEEREEVIAEKQLKTE